MKKFFKRLFWILLVVFVIIQFFRPKKNIAEGMSVNDITTKYTIPQDVQASLKTACYDCHSNNTVYPWYNNIQPVAWWLANHVSEGKRDLNFSEFTTYNIGRQYRKLEQINSEIKEGEMPLSSYTLIHKDAVLSAPQKMAIASWVTSVRDSIKAHYPEDSLKRPQKPQQEPAK
ncbi:MAG: heme-binding domain-containing protein [Bacteroidetes bacterium]|nr:heme-binding domain-containing protein [Bacteroidota bacterium]